MYIRDVRRGRLTTTLRGSGCMVTSVGGELSEKADSDEYASDTLREQDHWPRAKESSTTHTLSQSAVDHLEKRALLYFTRG